MSRNQIGYCRRARGENGRCPSWEQVTSRSLPTDEDKGAIGFMLTANGQAEGKKESAGSLSWGGINNTFFWV